MRPIRVLVVEDSLTVRAVLCDVLSRDPELEVVGVAEDGRRAIEQCEALRPDVITMDMMLPVMSGLAATEYIMAYRPTPILIVSSSTNRGELFRTYEALAAGAVDVLDKPKGDEPDGAWERRFVATVKLVSRIRVITHPRARLREMTTTAPPPVHPRVHGRRECRLVAIGASTGGPGALREVLRALPADFPIAVIVLLHLGATFGHSFAAWLETELGHPVAIAKDNEPLVPAASRIVMAPPSRHLIVRDGRLHLTDGAERNSCRPSIDVLFESIAADLGGAVAACLLTGMGKDGAGGLLQLRRAGAYTIAQDEATSVVYGMPREAALLGAPEQVLPLAEIGPALAALARRDA